MSDECCRYIVKLSGGILLLAKAGIRITIKENLHSLKKIRSIIPKHQEYLFQINLFWHRLTYLQQDIIKKIARLEEIDNPEVLHLIKMKIIDKEDFGLKVKSKAIHDFLQEPTRSKEILFKEINNSNAFTRREKKLLITLAAEEGQVVSRDYIADTLWGDKKYDKSSDWAIDKMISRLRKKINLELDSQRPTIKTHKKLGFSLFV